MANDFYNGTKVARMIYDASVDASGAAVAAATVTPVITEVIPVGAIITDVKVMVITAVVTSSAGTATVAFTGGGVTLKAAETIANSVLGTGSNAIVDVVRAGNSASTGTAKYVPIVATSSAPLQVVQAVAGFASGKFELFVSYLMP